MPVHLRLVTGNAGKRAADVEPDVQLQVEAPECPEYLSADARAEWDRIVPDLIAARLLAKTDRMALAAYCESVALWQLALSKIAEGAEKDPDGAGLIKRGGVNHFEMFSQWFNVRNRAFADMMKAIAEFGLSPSSRARVKALDSGQGALFPDDPMEALLRAGQRARA